MKKWVHKIPNFILYLSVVIIFGSMWLAVTFQTETTIPPMVSICYRFACASIVLFLWLSFKNKPFLKLSFFLHFCLLLQGFFMFCMSSYLVYLAAEYMASGLVCVAVSTLILFNLGLGYCFFKTPFSAKVVLGACLGVLGIAIIFGQDFKTLYGEEKVSLGLFLGVSGAFFSSLGSMISVYTQKKGCPVLENTAYSMAYGALSTMILCLIKDVAFTFDYSVAYVGSLLYLAIGGSTLGSVLYLTLLGKVGPEKGGYVHIATPAVALMISSVFEGFTWTLPSIIGLVLVAGGNLFILREL
jgi:drug/metabolite transporter (DMT)-like permease